MIENKSLGSKFFDILNVVILIAITLICIVPVWYVLCVSLSSREAVNAGQVALWPVGFNLLSYKKIMGETAFFGSFLVSIKRVLLGTGISMVCILMAAFPLSRTKKQFPKRDAINLTDSNRLDGVEQFIQALMLFHNVDISSEDFDELRERGAIKFKDIDPQLKAEINYLVSNLNQGETQTLVDHMYQTVLTICGMPNRNGGSSTSDTGSAVIMRDGWSAAEARAKDSELMFKKSERIFLKVVLNICRTLADMDLKVCNVEIRFTRRNYENILQKAQVLDLMLKNNKIHPRLAFEHCGLFVDSDLAYTLSAEYAEEQEQKAQELFEQQQRMKQEGNDDDSGNNEGNGGADGKSAETREQSGNTD